MSDTITTQARAKVNFFLRVFGRDESGFHGLETLFGLLELHDTLEAERIPTGIELTVEGAETGPVEENLAYRAAEMVLNSTGNRSGIRMHLTKRIPPMAGLGGGSSDAAAALDVANRLMDSAVPRHELLQFAARLGSDVPFFTTGYSMALAWNRGERLFRIAGPPASPALVILPDFGISTAAAYKVLDISRSGDTSSRGAVALQADAFTSWGNIGRLGGNDFESPLFAEKPKLRELFENVAETRPLTVRLSGSGSAVFAVYKSESELEDAVMTVKKRDTTVIKTRTVR